MWKREPFKWRENSGNPEYKFINKDFATIRLQTMYYLCFPHIDPVSNFVAQYEKKNYPVPSIRLPVFHITAHMDTIEELQQ